MKEGRGKKGLRILIVCVLAICIAMLGGCEKGGASDLGNGSGQGGAKGKELPEDTPWNHGFNAIMETEGAYYTNLSGIQWLGKARQALRYYDKASGETILLCNKPECSHSGGDSCEATYRNIVPINTCLYQGSIYELAVETDSANISINLYKAALDGSSIDKIGSVISEPDVKDEEVFFQPSTNNVYNGINQRPDYGFIIHKGYAYVPYYLRFGKGMMGLRGAGLVRMNLTSGETEEIYKVESLTVGIPCNVTGAGDYVYFLLSTTTGSGRTLRYDLATKEVEAVKFTFSDQQGNVKETDYPCTLYGPDRYYLLGKHEGKVGLTPYDAKTKELLKEEIINTETGEEGGYVQAAFFYDGKLFIGEQAKAWFFSTDGTQLAQVDAPADLIGTELAGKKASSYYQDYKISEGKLYYLFYDVNSDVTFQVEETDPATSGNGADNAVYQTRVYHVYYCSLEDVFQGKATWTKAYDAEGRMR